MPEKIGVDDGGAGELFQRCGYHGVQNDKANGWEAKGIHHTNCSRQRTGEGRGKVEFLPCCSSFQVPYLVQERGRYPFTWLHHIKCVGVGAEKRGIM